MSNAPHSLTVFFHLTDGSKDEFYQGDSDMNRDLLAKIQPQKLFAQPRFTIESDEGVFSYPTATVEFLEFIMEGHPSWARNQRTDIRLIGAKEFEGQMSRGPILREEHRRAALGDPLVTYGEVELRSGRKHYIELHAPKQSPIEQRRRLSQVLEAGTIMAVRPTGGVVFINTATILRITLYPGPAQLSSDGWMLHRR